MSAQVTISGSAELAAKLKALGEIAVSEKAYQALQAGGLVIQKAAQDLAPRKTSTLARSITIKKVSDTLLTVGPTIIYARIHEFGGTIRPRNRKFLSIPVSGAAKAAVSPTEFAGKLHFVGNDSRGTLRDENNVVHFALVKSVTIKPHPYMRPAVDNNQTQIADKVKAVFAALLRAA